jgi:hypothetical protein
VVLRDVFTVRIRTVVFSSVDSSCAACVVAAAADPALLFVVGVAVVIVAGGARLSLVTVEGFEDGAGGRACASDESLLLELELERHVCVVAVERRHVCGICCIEFALVRREEG